MVIYLGANWQTRNKNLNKSHHKTRKLEQKKKQ